jgi:hypothetical protein
VQIFTPSKVPLPCVIPLAVEDALSHWVPRLGPKVFLVRTLVDEEGEVLDHHVERDQFNVGRAGDHLITPFQCELCHFRNIYSRDPSSCVATDQETLKLLRQASLDAFWSRATTMVQGNLTEGKQGRRFAAQMGLPCLIPEMGPLPLYNSMGMMGAAAVLDGSLDPGCTEQYVQWDTFWGTRSFITIATQARSLDSRIPWVGTKKARCGFQGLLLIRFGSPISWRGYTNEWVKLDIRMNPSILRSFTSWIGFLKRNGAKQAYLLSNARSLRWGPGSLWDFAQV